MLRLAALTLMLLGATTAAAYQPASSNYQARRVQRTGPRPVQTPEPAFVASRPEAPVEVPQPAPPKLKLSPAQSAPGQPPRGRVNGDPQNAARPAPRVAQKPPLFKITNTPLAVGADGRTALRTQDGRIRIVEPKTGRQIVLLDVSGDLTLGAFKFSADDRTLMAVGRDGLLHRWQLDSGREQTADLKTLGARPPLDFSGQSGYLVAGEREGEGLALWNMIEHQRLRLLDDSQRRYALLAISDDERWVAGVRQGAAGQIDLWRADTGERVGVLNTSDATKHKMRFSPSGDQLLVFGDDGHGIVLAIPSGAHVDRFQAQKPGGGVRTLIRPDLGVTQHGGSGATTSIAPRVAKSAAPRSKPPHAFRTDPATPGPSLGSAAPGSPAPEALMPGAAAPGSAAPEDESDPPRDEPKASAPVETETAAPAPTAAAPGAAAPPTPASPAPSPEHVFPSHPAPTPPPPAEPMPQASASREDVPPEPAAPDESGAAESAETAGEAMEEASADDSADEAMADSAEASDEETADSGEEPSDAETADSSEESSDATVGAAAPRITLSPGRREVVVEASEVPVGSGGPAVGAAPPRVAARAAIESAAAAPSLPPRSANVSASPKLEVKEPVSSVTIHYATNRNRLTARDRQFMEYFLGFFSSTPAFAIYAVLIVSQLILPWLGKRSWAFGTFVVGLLLLCGMGALEAQVRSKLRDEMTGELFGARPADLSYGTCQISVPKPQNRQAGEVNRPVSVWIFEAPQNPDKHFTLRKIDEQPDKEAFHKSLSARLAEIDSHEAMLFIHGYNVSFEDALFRTAQLTVDLGFTGVPITFSWPSCADPVKYTFDEQQAEVSIPAFREFLEDLAARSGAKRIHIIAHSMGNRVLAGALRQLDPTELAKNGAIFDEVVMAAPDIDSRVFKSQVLPYIVKFAEHCTLYTSSRDRALLMSRIFHNFQRLGETDPDLMVAQGIDTIDATQVDTSLLGHSYIGDVRSIVSDLHALLISGQRPINRSGLQSLHHGELPYWSIKP